MLASINLFEATKNLWCPGAELNQRHADFQAAAKPIKSNASLRKNGKPTRTKQQLTGKLSNQMARIFINPAQFKNGKRRVSSRGPLSSAIFENEIIVRASVKPFLDAVIHPT